MDKCEICGKPIETIYETDRGNLCQECCYKSLNLNTYQQKIKITATWKEDSIPIIVHHEVSFNYPLWHELLKLIGKDNPDCNCQYCMGEGGT